MESINITNKEFHYRKVYACQHTLSPYTLMTMFLLSRFWRLKCKKKKFWIEPFKIQTQGTKNNFYQNHKEEICGECVDTNLCFKKRPLSFCAIQFNPLIFYKQ